MDSRDEDGPLESWLVRIRGRVQGVGFRDACMRRAHALGITGWVRNRLDGSVEALLQGPSEQLAKMRGWLRHGVSTASVDGLDAVRLQPPLARFDRFECRPTE